MLINISETSNSPLKQQKIVMSNKHNSPLKFSYHNESNEDMGVDKQDVDEALYDDEKLVNQSHDTHKNDPTGCCIGPVS